MNYYEILKNSRTTTVNLQANSNTSLLSYVNDTGKKEIKTIPELLSYLTWLGILDSKSRYSNQQLFFHTIEGMDGELFPEYNVYNYYPLSIFSMADESYLLSFSLIQRLMELYSVSNFQNLILIAKEKNDNIALAVDIVRDLITSNGGIFYGFFCYYSSWAYNLENVKIPMKVRKFTIKEDFIDTYISQLRINKRCDILHLKSKETNIIKINSNSNWIFSLTEEHLQERINVLFVRYKTHLESLISNNKLQIKKSREESKLTKEKLGRVFELLETIENNNNIWQWRNF